MTPIARGTLMLSAQRALLGAIGPSWRAVWVGLKDGVLHFHPVVDGPISDDDRDAGSVATAEIVSDFPDAGWEIDEGLWVCPSPDPLPGQPGMWLAYLRRGEVFARGSE